MRKMFDSNCCSLWDEGQLETLSSSMIDGAVCVRYRRQCTLLEHLIHTIDPKPKTWIFDMIGTLSHAQVVQLAITLWAIWSARRKAIHEVIFQRPFGTHEFINSYIGEIEILQKPTSMKDQRLSTTMLPSGTPTSRFGKNKRL